MSWSARVVACQATPVSGRRSTVSYPTTAERRPPLARHSLQRQRIRLCLRRRAPATTDRAPPFLATASEIVAGSGRGRNSLRSSSSGADARQVHSCHPPSQPAPVWWHHVRRHRPLFPRGSVQCSWAMLSDTASDVSLGSVSSLVNASQDNARLPGTEGHRMALPQRCRATVSWLPTSADRHKSG